MARHEAATDRARMPDVFVGKVAGLGNERIKRYALARKRTGIVLQLIANAAQCAYRDRSAECQCAFVAYLERAEVRDIA